MEGKFERGVSALNLDEKFNEMFEELFKMMKEAHITKLDLETPDGSRIMLRV